MTAHISLSSGHASTHTAVCFLNLHTWKSATQNFVTKLHT